MNRKCIVPTTNESESSKCNPQLVSKYRHCPNGVSRQKNKAKVIFGIMKSSSNLGAEQRRIILNYEQTTRRPIPLDNHKESESVNNTEKL